MSDETSRVSRETASKLFVIGDAVRLKGGVAGPFMSVIGFHLDSVRTCWFDTNTFEVREAYFPAACLETIEQFKIAARSGVMQEIGRRARDQNWDL